MRFEVLQSSMREQRVKQLIIRSMEILDYLRSQQEENTYQQLCERIYNKCLKDLGGTWYIIAGLDFGSFVTYQRDSVLFFRVDNVFIFIWRFV